MMILCLLLCSTELTFAKCADVKVEDSFWSPRFERWRTVTVPDVLDKFENRSFAVRNFDRAAAKEKGGHAGDPFYDGILLESIRGASDYLARYPSKDLDTRLDGLVDRIVAAQLPDGYLHTGVQLSDPRTRWGENGACALELHEVYNLGCLIEAGVHHYRATGKRKLLAAAVRAANLLCDTMGPRPKRNAIPTHSIAEAALVELVRLTKEDPSLAEVDGARTRPDDYRALVKFWFENHGNNAGEPDWETLGVVRGVQAVRKMTAVPHDPSWRPSWGDYQMDRKPLDGYRSIEGHAVRAVLLCDGLAAYANETGDAKCAELAARFWASMTGRKLYLTGGVGSNPRPELALENFGDDYSLPPDAYLETCAAVGNAFFSAEMAALTGEGMYMDGFERVLYNALLTAVSEDGCHYTYQNPLNTAKGERWDWHKVPCCPPMFLKLTGAMPGYAYAKARDGYVVSLFLGGSVAFSGGPGGKVVLSQKTRYPEDGRVEIAVTPERPAAFVLRVRIPGWARGEENPFGLYTSDLKSGWTIAVNGRTVQKPVLEKGYAVIDRTWAKGDAVTLDLDVSPRRITASPRVKELEGLVAEMRGPVVFAEENGRTIPYWQVANGGPAPHRVWRPADRAVPGRVRMRGWVGDRAETLINARVRGAEAEGIQFEETERAFETCYDDVHPTKPGKAPKGWWQGEYWGKTVLSMAGYARYADDRHTRDFLEAKALKLLRAHQRPDGYLATYTNADFIVGWNWNIWGRKYTMWALLEVWQLTGNREILDGAAKMADHLIAQLKRLDLSLADTGCFVGLPSMSILKPMLILHEETKEARYLDFARQIVALNDRADGKAPNLIANAFGDSPLHAWYPEPNEWAKAYELMSVLEGFVEYAKVTGEHRPLEATERIWEKLVRDELNVLGGVGLKDHFVQAAASPNAITEVCDIIHWMRLNCFLYEATGKGKYLDFWERAFLNGFLAGVFRDGKWGAHDVRSHGHRHFSMRGEIEMEHHFCCIDNAPRAYWDYADVQVRERDDRVEVNFYTDATYASDGLALAIEGDYPHCGAVVLRVTADRPRRISLRVPDWARGTMTVDGRAASGERTEISVGRGATTVRLGFDVTPRTEKVVLRPPVGEDLSRYRSESFEVWWKDPEMKGLARKEPGTVTRKGPLLMAKKKGIDGLVPFAEAAETDDPTNEFSVFGLLPHSGIGGVHPELSYYNEDGECGTGAVVPWAGSLWVVTYPPHRPAGSEDKLWRITEDYRLEARSESIGGTHANRMIHRESNQLLIGPYLIDAQGKVRAVPTHMMPGRLTGTARSVTDPAHKVYVTDMEEALYELDVRDLSTRTLIRDGHNKDHFDRLFAERKVAPPPGWAEAEDSALFGYHGKGTCSGFGKVFYANNGWYNERAMKDPTTPAGALAEWRPGDRQWTLIRTNQFTEVTTRDGIWGNEHPDSNQIWALGWDAKSVILTVTTNGTDWVDYRLPKGLHSYDGAHGWNTEWPRIREIGDRETLLATMHGTFWRFPADFRPGHAHGIRPRSNYLKVIGDFCAWQGKVVLGCDDSAMNEFMNKRSVKGTIKGPAKSHSNIRMIDEAELDRMGPPIGNAVVWRNEAVRAGATSDPYLIAGYGLRWLWVSDGEYGLEVDVDGSGKWTPAGTVRAGGTDLSQLKGEWVRFVARRASPKAMVALCLRAEDGRTAENRAPYRAIPLDDEAAALLHVNAIDPSALSVSAGGRRGYKLDKDLRLSDCPAAVAAVEESAPLAKTAALQEDAASLVYTDDAGGRWRLPRMRADFPMSTGRICREVCTERDHFNAGGLYYELPAENAHGFAGIRPVCAHGLEIRDYCSWRGLFVLSLPGELRAMAIDDFWKAGKPVGVGGPWKQTAVKGGEWSDRYLMNGFDRKALTLSADRDITVTLAVDADGWDSWIPYATYRVTAGKTLQVDFPRAFGGYWARLTSDRDAMVTAQFAYE